MKKIAIYIILIYTVSSCSLIYKSLFGIQLLEQFDAEVNKTFLENFDLQNVQIDTLYSSPNLFYTIKNNSELDSATKHYLMQPIQIFYIINNSFFIFRS